MLLPLETVGLVLHPSRFSQVYAGGQDRSTRPWALPLCSACFLLPESLGSASICCHSRNSSMCLCLVHWPFASPGTLGPSSGSPHALCWPRLQGDSVLFPASLHPAALPGGGSISKPQRAGGSSARAGLVQRWRGAQPCAHPGSCQLSGEPRLGWFFLLLGMTSLHSLQRAGREGGRACA